MKAIAPIMALAGILGALWPRASSDEWTLVITGDYRGQLSPCGCTKPMTGGIRRAATALRTLGPSNRILLLANGALTAETGRQQELKALALAESLRAMRVDAINLTNDDARLGAGMLLSIHSLSGNRLLSSSIDSTGAVEHLTKVERGPFAIYGLAAGAFALARNLGAQEASPEFDDKVGLVMLDGDLEQAHSFARQHPSVKLVIYRSPDSAPRTPQQEGDAFLLTPGVEGKSLVSIKYSNTGFSGYKVIDLGPKYGDDGTVSRFYGAYLRNVNDAKLIEKIPRSTTDRFAGTATCASCHASAGKVWKSSHHAQALKSLEREGHDRDPECVSCHVVGLESTNGFRSLAQTPDLANVGCESCHGPGRAHSDRPKLERLPEVGEKTCLPCHNSKNSPAFSFLTYWKSISHR